jgi:hypothetical protein
LPAHRGPLTPLENRVKIPTRAEEKLFPGAQHESQADGCSL